MEGQVGFLIPGSTGYGYCSQAQPVTAANQWACANGSLATAATDRAVGERVQERQRRRVADLGRDAARACRGSSTTATRDTYGLRTAYDAMKLYLDVTMEKWRKAPDYTPPSGSTEDEHTVTSFLGDWSFPTGAAASNAGRGHQRQRHRGHQLGQHRLLRVPGQAHGRLGARARQEPTRRRSTTRCTPGSSATSTPASGTRRAATTSTQNTTFMSQAAQVLALAHGPRAGRASGARCRRSSSTTCWSPAAAHQLTGIASARWIYPVLTEAAHEGVPNAAKAAFTAAQQLTYPSYGYWFTTLGFTGVGENWESGHAHAQPRDVRHDRAVVLRGRGRHQEPRAGLQEDPDPAADHAGRDLASASASYDSVEGPIKSSWTQTAAGHHDERHDPRQHHRQGLRARAATRRRSASSRSGKALLAKDAPGVSLRRRRAGRGRLQRRLRRLQVRRRRRACSRPRRSTAASAARCRRRCR